MINEVEIIKIGELVKQPNDKVIVMTVEESDPVVAHYISILKDYCESYSPKYSFLRTSGIIRSTADDMYKRILSVKTEKGRNVKGKPDGLPVVGQRYTISNGFWGTSVVESILPQIHGPIIITKNSVYVIHSLQSFRDIKLKDLGI